MIQETVAEKFGVPASIPLQCRVTLTGIILEHNETTWLPSQRRNQCRAIVEIEGTKFPVVFFDNLAERITGLLPGSVVHVQGKLTTHDWKSGDNHEHTSFEVVCDRLDVLYVRKPEGVPG